MEELSIQIVMWQFLMRKAGCKNNISV